MIQCVDAFVLDLLNLRQTLMDVNSLFSPYNYKELKGK